MSMPVIDRIVATVKARLMELATTRSEMDGNVVIVRPGRPVDNDAFICIQQHDPVPAPANNRQGNPPAIGFSCPIHIHAKVKPRETEELYAQECNQLIAEIIYEITNNTEDGYHWFNFDGNALLATLTPMSLPNLSGATSGVTVALLVTYRVAENDHTVARN